ncbi:hypothetical protein D3C76_1499920 [compost metagenome]
MHAGSALRHPCLTDVQQQCTPQLRLPGIGRGQRLGFSPAVTQLVTTFRPVFKPIGAINLVLVEQIRQPLRQLIAFAQIGVMGKKAL